MSGLRYFCQTCPYVFDIQHTVGDATHSARAPSTPYRHPSCSLQPLCFADQLSRACSMHPAPVSAKQIAASSRFLVLPLPLCPVPAPRCAIAAAECSYASPHAEPVTCCCAPGIGFVQLRRRAKLHPKKVDDVLDDEKMWQNAQKTNSGAQQCCVAVALRGGGAACSAAALLRLLCCATHMQQGCPVIHHACVSCALHIACAGILLLTAVRLLAGAAGAAGLAGCISTDAFGCKPLATCQACTVASSVQQAIPLPLLDSIVLLLTKPLTNPLPILLPNAFGCRSSCPAANCPNCHNSEAYFYEMQTRSADEPATVFYRCSNQSCKKVWSEN